jgi:hypothetical protein
MYTTTEKDSERLAEVIENLRLTMNFPSLVKYISVLSIISGISFAAEPAVLSDRRAFMIGGAQSGDIITIAVQNNFDALERALNSWAVEKYFWNGNPRTNTLSTDQAGMRHFTQALQGIKTGEVLIYIDGDGAARQKGQKSHSLNVAGARPYNLFDLDQLEPLIRTLTSRGVRVAIVDLTCFSGATQMAYRDIPGLCVVTSATSNYYSQTLAVRNLGYFDQALVKAFDEPGISTMQDAFLYASFLDKNNFPQISSLVTPDLKFFEYFGNAFDPLGMFRSTSGPSGNVCLSCAAYDYVSKLPAMYNQMTSFGADELDSEMLSLKDKLRNSLADYAPTFMAISKVVFQLRPSAGVDIQTGFEEVPIYRLHDMYKNLSTELQGKATVVRAQQALMYHRYQTGHSNYENSNKPLRKRRINPACENFSLH